MSNLTITIDEETLRRARIRALEQGTSVNALLRDYLEGLAGVNAARRAAVDDLVALSSEAGIKRGSWRFSRDDIHERVENPFAHTGS
jgi:plasmid stability protein